MRILVAVNPRFPGRTNLAQETLGLRRPEFSSGLSLLVSAFSLNGAPRPLSVLLHCTEAADSKLVRQLVVVGERERCSEAEPKGDVERRSVRMQTRVP